jgi:hypothetical protein
MRLSTFSPILGTLSGNLEIIITDFRVSIGSQSYGEFRSYSLQSSKPSYLSSFADNLFMLLGISSSNTSMSHFLLSLPSASVERRVTEEEEEEDEEDEEDSFIDPLNEEEQNNFQTIGIDSEEEEASVSTTILEDELGDFRNMYGEIMISEPEAKGEGV